MLLAAAEGEAQQQQELVAALLPVYCEKVRLFRCLGAACWRLAGWRRLRAAILLLRRWLMICVGVDASSTRLLCVFRAWTFIGHAVPAVPVAGAVRQRSCCARRPGLLGRLGCGS
jgi:hypothetical protein